MIEFSVRPGPGLIKEHFLSSHPPYSVALDGYVFGGPWLETLPAGPFRNFNHHEEVDRTCTSATCEQVRRAIMLGFYDLFQVRGDRTARLYANDCDQDVCLAAWILMNPDRADEPLVRTISQIVDLLDMSAGTYPMPHERELLGQVRWVFDPYTRVRSRLSEMTGEVQLQVIEDVHRRLDQFSIGRADIAERPGSYVYVGGGRGWTMAKLDHQSGRDQLIADGVRAAVELIGRASQGYTYTVWRRSEYVVGFPVGKILQALNVAEGFQPIDPKGWGGSNNVGGSPRCCGSTLSPEEVERVVNHALESEQPIVRARAAEELFE